MSILVVDVGTSSVRAAVVDGDARVVHEETRPLLPSSPAPGLVEFDATGMAATALDAARAAFDAAGPVDAVGIANQRCSTVVWDRATGEPVGPALGWQDLRTVGRCLELRGQGLRLAPNASATKLEWLLEQVDPERGRDLCFGTVDTWMAWTLSGGALHVTDATNAAVTGLLATDASGWSEEARDPLRIPASMLPTIVDSWGIVGEATALPGAPPIAGIAGDQQASLLGQGCVHCGDAKITFGTGGMLDLVLGGARPPFESRGPGGTFPIVCRRVGGTDTWGVEAIMLAAGTNIEWLRDDLGVLASAAESHDVASQCDDTDDVWYVPALLGVGTPAWDYGARGTLLGLTRGTGRPHLVRAVLEGVAHLGHRRPAPAHRRRDEREPDVRAGARRRRTADRRGLARDRGDDTRRRVPRRARRGHVARRGRGGRYLVAAPARRAATQARPRPLARGVAPRRPLDPRPQRGRLLTRPRQHWRA